MHEEIKVLDHGYVRLVESWGHGDAGNHTATDYQAVKNDDECGLVEAARQSSQGSFRGWDHDERLLGFLQRNNHQTPFEFGGMVVEVQAPLCVVAEWQRHRTCSLTDDSFPGDVGYNQASARYGPLPAMDFMPSPDRCLAGAHDRQSGAVTGADVLTDERAAEWLNQLGLLQQLSRSLYADGLGRGVPKELARLALTVGAYTRFRATAYLRNWLGFIALRDHPAAQLEIRQYARVVGGVLEERFPRTWSLFQKGRTT